MDIKKLTILVAGRGDLTDPLLSWIERARAENRIRVAPLSPAVVVESTSLQGFHMDPADQIIVAKARVAGWPLVSVDDRIRSDPQVETIW